MALYLSFVSGVCFLSGVLLLLKGGQNIKNSGRNVHLVFIGLALMAGANNLRLHAEKKSNEIASLVNTTKTQISRIKTIGEQKPNGHPICYDNLPDGTYNRLEESGHFAFVYCESENPFEQSIIAVYSDEKIPWRFAIARIPKEIQKEIEKIEKKSIKIKNPFVAAKP